MVGFILLVSSQPSGVLQPRSSEGWTLRKGQRHSSKSESPSFLPSPVLSWREWWYHLLFVLWSRILHLGIAHGKYSWEPCNWIYAVGNDVVAHTWIARRFLCPFCKSQKSTRKKIKGRITQKISSFELLNGIQYMLTYFWRDLREGDLKVLCNLIWWNNLFGVFKTCLYICCRKKAL